MFVRPAFVGTMMVAAGLLAAAPAAQAGPQIASEDFMIASGDPGISLFVRNKHPAGIESFTPDKILLYVHGATYPSETAFDLPIDGVSMMDLFAAEGFDVYLVDVRGYGHSTRPPEMDQPPEANKPIVHTDVAAHDLGAAVDFVLGRRKVAKLDLMGWSWGTSIAGLYTSEHNDKINRLVLYAPLWLFKKDTEVAPAPQPNKATQTAYRLVSKADTLQRWLKGVPEDKRADLIPPGVFDAWADSTFATDPKSATHDPPMLRAPNGVIDDVVHHWMNGDPLYDPGKISVPTFIIHAEWDADLPSYQAQAYFTRLTNVPYKRFVELSEGTHSVMMEKNRMQFFREILLFLDEKHPLALK